MRSLLRSVIEALVRFGSWLRNDLMDKPLKDLVDDLRKRREVS